MGAAPFASIPVGPQPSSPLAPLWFLGHPEEVNAVYAPPAEPSAPGHLLLEGTFQAVVARDALEACELPWGRRAGGRVAAEGQPEGAGAGEARLCVAGCVGSPTPRLLWRLSYLCSEALPGLSLWGPGASPGARPAAVLPGAGSSSCAGDPGCRGAASAPREHGQATGAEAAEPRRALAALASATGACFSQTELLNRGLRGGCHSWFPDTTG